MSVTVPSQPCLHCSFISLCVSCGRSQLLAPHPFPSPLLRHAQQVVLTRDLLHSTLPSLLVCVYQLTTSDAMHMQFYRLFGKTLSYKAFTQLFSLPIMTWSTETKRVISIYIPSTQPGPCKLFWWLVPTCPAITALLNLDLRLSTLLPLHLTYAGRIRSIYVSLWWKVSQWCPRWPDWKLNRRNSSSASEMVWLMAWVILTKTDETHRQFCFHSWRPPCITHWHQQIFFQG